MLGQRVKSLCSFICMYAQHNPMINVYLSTIKLHKYLLKSYAGAYNSAAFGSPLLGFARMYSTMYILILIFHLFLSCLNHFSMKLCNYTFNSTARFTPHIMGILYIVCINLWQSTSWQIHAIIIIILVSICKYLKWYHASETKKTVSLVKIVLLSLLATYSQIRWDALPCWTTHKYFSALSFECHLHSYGLHKIHLFSSEVDEKQEGTPNEARGASVCDCNFNVFIYKL